MDKAILVAGLAYGDEGKGATVDFLCRKLPVDLVVRYNGGSQAAHNVVCAETGLHHTFAQFGSGMLANGRVRTHLSRFMLVDPLTMMNEANALEALPLGWWGTLGVWNRTTVDPRCVIITPFHKRVNRLRERARGDARHGSCGMGVGVAREWSLKYGDAVLHASDVLCFSTMVEKLWFMNYLVREEFGTEGVGDISILDLAHEYCTWPVTLQSYLPDSELAVFEGAQGVLLDEMHGVEPHRTWTDCTFGNAYKVLEEAGLSGVPNKDGTRVLGVEVMKIGCLRTYHTRHGAGPFPTETNEGMFPPELHNGTGEWQGEFRRGRFDWSSAGAALDVIGGVDGLALSHLDGLAEDGDAFMRDVMDELETSIYITAVGPTASHRQFTKDWFAR